MMWRTQAVEFHTYQGDTFNPRLNLRDGEGNALDTAGMVFEYFMIQTKGSESLTVELSSEDGDIEVVYDGDRVSYVQPIIAAADTADLTPGTYKCELRVTDAQDNRGTAFRGTHIIGRQLDR